MWLLNVDDINLEEFEGDKVPPYAILSHRWEGEEVLHQHILAGTASSRKGYWKILRCCDQAKTDGLQYAWVDTCCIDKKSSAELSEAINSMYHWYAEAHVCYVYLSDFKRPPQPDKAFSGLELSAWFTRGWTLQELLAPSNIIFYDQDWSPIGHKQDLEFRQTLSEATSIPQQALINFSADHWRVAEKMRWAAGRVTTRIEDQAYSLLGLFGINMPLLYGEREKAFLRLQEEIIKGKADRSIFAWTGCLTGQKTSMFASSVKQFQKYYGPSSLSTDRKLVFRQTFTSSNDGLKMDVVLEPLTAGVYVADLYHVDDVLQIFLRRTDKLGGYIRVVVNESWFYESWFYEVSEWTNQRIAGPSSSIGSRRKVVPVIVSMDELEWLHVPKANKSSKDFLIRIQLDRLLAQNTQHGMQSDKYGSVGFDEDSGHVDLRTDLVEDCCGAHIGDPSGDPDDGCDPEATRCQSSISRPPARNSIEDMPDNVISQTISVPFEGLRWFVGYFYFTTQLNQLAIFTVGFDFDFEPITIIQVWPELLSERIRQTFGMRNSYGTGRISGELAKELYDVFEHRWQGLCYEDEEQPYSKRLKLPGTGDTSRLRLAISRGLSGISQWLLLGSKAATDKSILLNCNKMLHDPKLRAWSGYEFTLQDADCLFFGYAENTKYYFSDYSDSLEVLRIQDSRAWYGGVADLAAQCLRRVRKRHRIPH